MSDTGLTLDAGALVAVERRVTRVLHLLDTALRRGQPLHVLPDVLAQAWRGGPRQAELAKFLSLPQVTCPNYDELTARAVGVLCGTSGHSDVVDVHVALHARRNGHQVVTSDGDDLRRIDPTLQIIEI